MLVLSQRINNGELCGIGLEIGHGLLLVLRFTTTDFMLLISPIYSVINRQKFVGVGIEEVQGLYMHV